MYDQKDMIDLEEKSVRIFKADVEFIHSGQLTGFYIERRFRSNQIILAFQVWEEDEEGNPQLDWFGDERGTYSVANEEEAQARFDDEVRWIGLPTESWEQENLSDLVFYFQHYKYDRFDILAMYDGEELPEFIQSEDEANELADKALGTTLDENMEKASWSLEAGPGWDYQQRQERLIERRRYKYPILKPEQLRAHFWGGVIAVVIVLVLLFN